MLCESLFDVVEAPRMCVSRLRKISEEKKTFRVVRFPQGPLLHHASVRHIVISAVFDLELCGCSKDVCCCCFVKNQSLYTQESSITAHMDIAQQNDISILEAFANKKRPTHTRVTLSYLPPFKVRKSHHSSPSWEVQMVLHRRRRMALSQEKKKEEKKTVFIFHRAISSRSLEKLVVKRHHSSDNCGNIAQCYCWALLPSFWSVRQLPAGSSLERA